tara:strand:+ start:436 stop:747 length:312 start_codon:yes stop_codon:yes gene_type:complete
MNLVGEKDNGKRTNFDTIPVNGKTPSSINFCGWIELGWGWRCHVGNDIATYCSQKVQDGYGDPPVLFQKEWITVAAFKIIKLKDLHEKEVKYKQNLLERVNNL